MSKISYEALKVEGLKEVLTQISDTCLRLGIDFFIVGAVARNLWLVENQIEASGTRDVDLAVFIPNNDAYHHLQEALKEKYAYEHSRENAFCMLTPEGVIVDLLPFGAIADEDQVILDGVGLAKINLAGFNEVFQSGLSEVHIGEENYKACSIPAMVILKMIAFDDRPDRRIKDVKDIASICRYYPDIETDMIWSDHFDLYGGTLEHDEVAMIVLGREMSKVITINAALRDRICSIIDTALEERSQFLVHMIDDAEQETLEMKSRCLRHIRQGLLWQWNSTPASP